jgi:hypothetical protein
MSDTGIERRTCLRFEIPGATLNYKISRILPTSLEKYDEEFCQVIDISRGGLRFQAKKRIEIDAILHMNIAIPGERVPLTMNGRVRWSTPTEDIELGFQVGVQFNAYGEKKDQNYPGNLVKIIALEQKFCPPPETTPKTGVTDSDYEVDG